MAINASNKTNESSVSYHTTIVGVLLEQGLQHPLQPLSLYQNGTAYI